MTTGGINHGNRILRFLLSGSVNTFATYLLYLLLLQKYSYQFSYTVSYAGGIVLAYGLNRAFVFQQHQGVKTVLSFPLVYLIQYLVGMVVIWAWVDCLRLAEALAPLIAIVLTVPMTYVLSHIAFAGKLSSPGLREKDR